MEMWKNGQRKKRNTHAGISSCLSHKQIQTMRTARFFCNIFSIQTEQCMHKRKCWEKKKSDLIDNERLYLCTIVNNLEHNGVANLFTVAAKYMNDEKELNWIMRVSFPSNLLVFFFIHRLNSRSISDSDTTISIYINSSRK